MPPLDGTFLQAQREWVIAICFARNAQRAGEIASLILASDACTVPFERVGGFGNEGEQEIRLISGPSEAKHGGAD